MNNYKMNRRNFLKTTLATAVGASPLLSLLGPAGNLRAAETSGGYKAIVCVLLEGGADVFNMVAPTQQDAYADYRSAREDIAVSRSDLIPFSHTDENGLNTLAYGMRSNMSAMQGLFEQKKLSIVANVGTLVRPVTPNDVINGSPVPTQLFSHNSQRALWMMGNAKDIEKRGWAARAGDAFYPSPNPYFNITVGGNNIMQSGGIAEALPFSEAEISPNTMTAFGFGPESGGGDLGSVYQQIYQQQQTARNKLLATFATRRMEELDQQVTLQNLFDGVADFSGFSSGVHETGKPLGKQLELVAKILSVRDNFPGQPRRQIFFVNHHGWDTHDSDNEHQAGYLSESLGAFQTALEKMGIADQVTTFTISDFGRSLGTNGAGTDHGWGSHAFVMGGAVRGGDIFGRMPALHRDSPDAWSNRMVPTTSMEQYLATIVKWFGATDDELNSIFPNLPAFANRDMGFMKQV
ncbi:MAG TPA: DUF1501 domain-containing protein [Gammaproteobacteria bacterium]|nr:DUF1501 domain-containing protein [Gammaproteobacteria bacterium]